MLETSRLQPIGCLFWMAGRDFEISVVLRPDLDKPSEQLILTVLISFSWS